ncbi:geranylgeranylglyceryl/heptaprenylglyceryl phosphate synthase [Ulvibacter antarcticus]|uniref:Geranylgeranylglyceryl phosphate synthase n=1 Tax=Ulvibacter antarcticus TaxID=442714 RepID=A0A3L9Z2E9_9FLAO|nr:geranylgeranylglyceryl/heptaprenylglyceryl phosphate synthase [Ulvibacter antarcticus]RMA66310.1 putative glycerol-1-phosphate prenyltransferase [Ulvibacter antarcticus]
MIYYQSILKLASEKKKGLAILIDPDKFDVSEAAAFLKRIPKETTHLFVGGSTVVAQLTEGTVKALKALSNLPVILFPGDYTQITNRADAVLFLSLLSGRNPEYLVGQQVKSVAQLRISKLEIIPTAYILIDGGHESAVARVSQTKPLSQDDLETVIHTALAGQYMGAKLIYLEAGSGAKFSVQPMLIRAVKRVLNIPLIVGGGIRSDIQKQAAFDAGADMVVMGTVFEE